MDNTKATQFKNRFEPVHLNVAINQLYTIQRLKFTLKRPHPTYIGEYNFKSKWPTMGRALFRTNKPTNLLSWRLIHWVVLSNKKLPTTGLPLDRNEWSGPCLTQKNTQNNTANWQMRFNFIAHASASESFQLAYRKTYVIYNATARIQYVSQKSPYGIIITISTSPQMKCFPSGGCHLSVSCLEDTKRYDDFI